MSNLETKAKTILFLSNECYYKNANFEQLWVPLVDAQKEITDLTERVILAEESRNKWSLSTQEAEAKIEALEKAISDYDTTQGNLSHKIITQQKQIEAANKILERTTDHEYGTVAYADYRTAQIDRLKVILEIPRKEEEWNQKIKESLKSLKTEECKPFIPIPRKEELTCDKSKEPPCHLEPSPKLCGKCSLNKEEAKTT
jgi:chromosome segregation ATPase